MVTETVFVVADVIMNFTTVYAAERVITVIIIFIYSPPGMMST